MRIGLFGGSFNPIHFGHLRGAEEVREALALDLVYFIPAASPPHKPDATLAPPDHRLHMVQLATKGNRHFMVSDVEIRRSGRSFTIDTIRHFIASMRGQPEFFLLMGGDQFAELETWKDCDELARLCNVVVHTRQADHVGPSAHLPLAVLNRFGYAQSENHYVHPSGHCLSFVQTTFLPISATLIRGILHQRKSIRYLLPADVADYIKQHNLY
jgi:nicotinate-nucleotide adenylyltransferase